MDIYNIDEINAGKRGKSYGVAIKNLVHDFLQDDLAQINSIRPQPISRKAALDVSNQFLQFLHRHLPTIWEEVKGLAIGAGITPEEAMLLQIRRELIGWSEDCTSLGFMDPKQGGTIAQTIDLSGSIERYVHVIRYRRATHKQGDILLWTYAGLLGYAGINSHGLAIGINMVLSHGWRVGVPPYLLVRHLLAQDSLKSCLEEIDKIPRASSRSLMLYQGNKLLNVEMTVEHHRILNGPFLVHCNHFLHPDFLHDEAIPSISTTYIRASRLEELLNQGKTFNVAFAKNILADHKNYPKSICAHAENVKQGRTVSALILTPSAKTIEVCFGNPCNSSFQEFSL